jgi:heme-degrading monooxygenase HmoA
VAYIFMAVHYPEPGRLDEVHASMSGMADAMAGTAGLLEIGPWLDRDAARVVGLSRWESREAFEAAMPGSGVPNTVTHSGESRPREYFHLLQPDPAGPA